jgi:type II secretory pathway predicted ATPase ExeA
MNLPYKEHFGLKQEPFNITADPAFLYLSRSHREALAQLSYGIKARKGFVVLTGEVGTGKTTLINGLLDELDGDTRTALIFSYIANPFDLLRYTCDEFGLKSPHHSRSDFYEYLSLLNDYLFESYHSGKNCALIIDEAQNLSSEVLESVRLLSNFETSKDKLLQILLVGQPELSTRLNSQELRQLKQRVTVRYQLRSLTLKECHEYIASRLQVAGGDPALFTTKAVEVIYACSGGIPRVINVICDGALITGYTLGKTCIDDALVRQVAEDLQIAGNVFSNRSAASEMGAATPPKPNVLKSLEAQPHKQSSDRPAPPELKQIEKDAAVPRSLVKVAESLEPQSSVLPRMVFDALGVILMEAMGPMASIVLKDRAASLGESLDRFPEDKLNALIELVSDEILDPSMRQDFQQLAQERVSTRSRLK